MGKINLETTEINHRYKDPFRMKGFHVFLAKGFRHLITQPESPNPTLHRPLIPGRITIPLPQNNYLAQFHIIKSGRKQFVYELAIVNGTETNYSGGGMQDGTVKERPEISVQRGKLFLYGGLDPLEKNKLFLEKLEEPQIKLFQTRDIEKFIKGE